ncbi:MAG: putative Ig domain-containing protein [Mycoplasmoidaceae bacterium]|nr:putative Ig domain-containing protein [Mycoplasmoidaceae bacterium]
MAVAGGTAAAIILCTKKPTPTPPGPTPPGPTPVGPTSLEIKKVLSNVSGIATITSISTPNLSKFVYTDLGDKVKEGLTFYIISSEELPEGIEFDPKTGVLSGTIDSEFETDCQIGVTATIDENQIYGESNPFKLTIHKYDAIDDGCFDIDDDGTLHGFKSPEERPVK